MEIHEWGREGGEFGGGGAAVAELDNGGGVMLGGLDIA